MTNRHRRIASALAGIVLAAASVACDGPAGMPSRTITATATTPATTTTSATTTSPITTATATTTAAAPHPGADQHAAPETGTAEGTVHPGAWCKHEGARGVTVKGIPMACTRQPGENQPRWRQDGAAPTTTTTTNPQANPPIPWTPTPPTSSTTTTASTTTTTTSMWVTTATAPNQ